MATTKTDASNVITEDNGGQSFRKSRFNAPAVEHARFPVSFVGVTNPDTFAASIENNVISVDATAHDVDVTLPSASGNNGVEITIKNRAGGNTVTVVPHGSESIDDQASVDLANMGDAITVTALDNEIETGWIITACVTGLS